MIADVLSRNDTLLIAAAVVFALGMGTVLALMWWGRRHGRRVLALAKRRTSDLTRLAAQRGWRWLLARPWPDRQWRSRQRHELLSAVAGAEHAVAAARRGSAAVGGLASLTRRLRVTAEALDASLALDQRASTRRPAAHDQFTEVMRAARDIQASASLALVAAHRPVTAELLADAERELAPVAAGLDAAHSQAGAPSVGQPLSVHV